jgi:hypothetical protein
MQKRKFFDCEDDEPEIYDMVGWDLPGLTKHKTPKAYRPKAGVARKTRG